MSGGGSFRPQAQPLTSSVELGSAHTLTGPHLRQVRSTKYKAVPGESTAVNIGSGATPLRPSAASPGPGFQGLGWCRLARAVLRGPAGYEANIAVSRSSLHGDEKSNC